MKSAIVISLVLTVCVASLAIGHIFNRGVEADTATSGLGGQLSLGAPSLLSGKLVIPVLTSASTDGYSGANIHLSWDPTLLSFSGFDTTGSTLSGGSPICVPAADSGGAGAVVACSAVGSFTTTAAGVLMDFKLTPVGPVGCSTIHVSTLNAPDNAGTTFGSYTINADDGQPQANTYGGDLLAPVNGGTCVAPTSTPTQSPTPTNTPSPTATATPTNTATFTATAISGAPDVVLALFATPTFADSGSNVTYSAFVANLGNVAAQGVSVQVTLPQGGVLLGVGQCPFYAGGVYSCPVGSLAADNNAPGGPDETVITLAARVPYSTQNLAAVIHGAVSATNEPLANQGNNSASASVTVEGCPDFNGDGNVNGLDLSLFVGAFHAHIGDGNYKSFMDLNEDGVIDGLDLSLLAGRYTANCVGLDRDRDGVPDSAEINTYHTCPGLDPQFQSLAACHVGGNTGNPLITDASDTDGDGVPDGVEVSTYGSSPLLGDTDSDWYSDGQEAAIGKNPTLYCATMAADLNMDGTVNALDLSKLSPAFLSTSSSPNYVARADINRSGSIDGLDLNIMAGVFLRSVSSCP